MNMVGRRALLGMAGAALGAACAPSAPAVTGRIDVPATGEPADPKRFRGSVVLYTTRSETQFKPVMDAFNREYPNITTSVLTLTNPILVARLLEERSRPQADVALNSDTLSFVELGASGAFAPNSSRAVMALPAEYRADDGSWASLTLRGRVIMYNSELVSAAEAPRSIFDLSDPKWRRQLGSANSTNGAMMGMLAGLRHLRGDAALEAFVRGLIANETVFAGHDDLRQSVGRGEIKLALVNHYYYFRQKAAGSKVELVIPDQGASDLGMIVNSTSIGIVKGSANQEAARIFVDYMLSETAQRIYAEQNFEVPVVKGVARAAGVPDLYSFKVANVPFKTMFDTIAPTALLSKRAGLP
jgi:iron(III) transport system substrate-binding protein